MKQVNLKISTWVTIDIPDCDVPLLIDDPEYYLYNEYYLDNKIAYLEEINTDDRSLLEPENNEGNSTIEIYDENNLIYKN